MRAGGRWSHAGWQESKLAKRQQNRTFAALRQELRQKEQHL
jgi:hypothetical protein